MLEISWEFNQRTNLDATDTGCGVQFQRKILTKIIVCTLYFSNSKDNKMFANK
jgi:hypothetical protein